MQVTREGLLLTPRTAYKLQIENSRAIAAINLPCADIFCNWPDAGIRGEVMAWEKSISIVLFSSRNARPYRRSAVRRLNFAQPHSTERLECQPEIFSANQREHKQCHD